MDPSLKNIATKTKNPWTLEGTPLKALDARLKKAGLHNPWLRNRAARIPEILNLQKGYYNYFHRHVPLAVLRRSFTARLLAFITCTTTRFSILCRRFMSA